MNIAIVGTGYVGLVTGTCFAETGANVTCVDVDSNKIENLKKGILPIYEPGLNELVERNFKNRRLRFTTDIAEVLDDVEIVFSAVGTPSDEDGSADLKYVLEVARSIGRNMKKYLVVVTKSTVPVGTAEKVRAVIAEELEKQHGITVDKRKILLDDAIKAFGSYSLDVKLYPEIAGKLNVVVTQKD